MTKGGKGMSKGGPTELTMNVYTRLGVHDLAGATQGVAVGAVRRGQTIQWDRRGAAMCSRQ